MTMTWPVRSVIAGAAGTATMTLAYATERRLRARRRAPLDYDDSLVPGEIVAAVMHLPHVTDREERDLGLLLRWSYGSAFGLLHGQPRRAAGEPWASAVFGGTLITATMTLFPLLGRTPPPWRWPADTMATSLGTHRHTSPRSRRWSTQLAGTGPKRPFHPVRVMTRFVRCTRFDPPSSARTPAPT